MIKKKPKKEKIKKRKTRKLKSISYIIIVILMAVVLLSGLILDFIDKRCINWSLENFRNNVGVLCQIISTLVVFIGTTIALTISLQNENCFGISLRDFNNLREDQRFSITEIVIASLLIPTFNAVFWLCGFTFSSISTAIIAIIFSIYVAICEMPFMLKNENAQLRIIKKRMEFQWKSKQRFPQTLDEVLKCIICDKQNLSTAFDLFSSKDKKYNKFLIITLLEKQEQQAFDLLKIEDKELQRKIADNLLDNVKMILYGNVDFPAIFGEDAKDYTHYITRVLFCLLELDEFTDKAADFIASIATAQDYTVNEKQRILVLNVALAMAAASLTSESFDVLKAFRKEFSGHVFRFGENKYKSILFSLISLHFYYLCNDGFDVSNELKEKIKTFIEFEGVEGRTIIISWKKLFQQQLESFDVDFKELFDYFKQVNHNWDVWLENSGAHFVSLNEKYFLQWYFMCLFQSSNVNEYDYKKLLVADEFKYYLKDLGDEILKALDKKEIPETMREMSKFYNIRENYFDWFIVAEQNEHRFAKFISDLHFEDVEKLLKNIDSVNRQEVIKHWRKQIIEEISKEYGFNEKIEIQNEPRYLNLLMQTHNEAVNFNEAIVSSIVRSVRHELFNKTPKTIIPKDNIQEFISIILSRNEKIHANRYVYYAVREDLDAETDSKFLAVLKDSTPLNSKILIGNILMIGDAFSFNLEIVQMKDIVLTAEQAANQVNEYKRADGQYVYEGAFVSREKIEEIVRKQYYILSIGIKYQIITNEDSIYKVQTKFDDEE